MKGEAKEQILNVIKAKKLDATERRENAMATEGATTEEKRIGWFMCLTRELLCDELIKEIEQL